MSDVKYGILHCHTDESIRDSVMTVKKLVKRAAQMEAPAIALTDSGVMTGYLDFFKECNNEGIKPIIGVEAYVEEHNEGCRNLILMAKDYEYGFKSLIKAVSESNERLDSNGVPRMNKDILARNFGPGSNGHGHVIATSADVHGVLAAIFQVNANIQRQVERYERTQAGLESPTSPGYLKNSGKLQWINDSLKENSKLITLYRKKSTKSLLTLEKKALSAPDGSQKKEIAQAAFDAALKEKSEAAKMLTAELQKKELLTAQKNFLSPVVKQAEKEIAKWKKAQEKIDEIKKNNIVESEVLKHVYDDAKWYQENFGKEDFYIELQYHGMKQEKELMPKLACISDELGIPVVLANDVHTPTNSGDDILARAIIRTTQDMEWNEPSAADREMYMKTDTELKTSLKAIIPENKVEEGYENIGKIVSQCHIEFPKEKHYPVFQPPDGSTPEEYLRRMAYEGIPKKYPHGFPNEKKYSERLEHELKVICSMGYASYFCIVEDFLRYARAAGKLDLNDPEQKALALTFDIERIEKFAMHLPGEAVGPGRGSAAGSLVCFLTGITNIDPIKYGLLFERFLNPERVSMPDIDCGATCCCLKRVA